MNAYAAPCGHPSFPLRDARLRSHLQSAFANSSVRLDHSVACIRVTRPTMRFGDPSSLTLIVRLARASGLRLDDLVVRLGFVTSERLYEVSGHLRPLRLRGGQWLRHSRCGLHRTRVPVRQPATELGRSRRRDHAPRRLRSRTGSVVHRHPAGNRRPPLLVRYQTGDMGALGHERCSCGRGSQVLREVEGRPTDFDVARAREAADA